MDKWEKRGNIIGASIFGALGLAALGGVILAGAVHQLAVAAICGVMTAAIVAEINRMIGIMKVYELLRFNRELLRRIHHAGIRPDDYKYADLYSEYEDRIASGEKVTYIVATLAAKYGVSERQVYSLLGKFGRDVTYCKFRSVE